MSLAKKLRQEGKKLFPPAFLEFFLFSLIFSLLAGNSSLLFSGVLIKKEQEIIKEGKVPLPELSISSMKNVYSYTTPIRVDGGSIFPVKDNDKNSKALALIDTDSVMALNSPSSPSQITNVLVSHSLSERQGIINYTVQKGDSVAKIAAKFNVSTGTILSNNNLNSRSLIHPGQKLIILPVSGIRYKVHKGDTLLKIAARYHSTVNKIVVFNNLKDAISIREGQIIIIPGGYSSEKQTYSPLLAHGLTPNTPQEQAAISKWPSLSHYFSFPTISSAYNIGILHHLNAVDITASCGSPIYAAADGFVYGIKRNDRWYGNEISIQHPNGTVTVYAHLSKVLVKEGDRIKKHDLIGRMGKTGNANGCHLHFEVHGAQNPFRKQN